MMSKIIFIDVDGTLLDYENKLPESANKAIKKARERKCIFAREEMKEKSTTIFGILD